MPNYHSLPNLTGYKSKAAKRILKLSEEHAQKMGELSALGRGLDETRTALQDAMSQDTSERALAARGGGTDPGRVHEEKVRERLVTLEDRYHVMEQVIADVEKDLTETITHSKMELLEEARTKRDDANRRYTAAKRALREVHDEQRHHAGVARWSLQAGPHFSPPPPDMHVLSVPERLPDEDPEHLAEVVSTESAPGLLRGA
jgi:chromosome segregation ATPase